MKNGKRPSKAQKIRISEEGLNPGEWLVVKNLPHKLEIVNRNGELKELAVWNDTADFTNHLEEYQTILSIYESQL